MSWIFLSIIFYFYFERVWLSSFCCFSLSISDYNLLRMFSDSAMVVDVFEKTCFISCIYWFFSLNSSIIWISVTISTKVFSFLALKSDRKACMLAILPSMFFYLYSQFYVFALSFWNSFWSTWYLVSFSFSCFIFLTYSSAILRFCSILYEFSFKLLISSACFFSFSFLPSNSSVSSLIF